MESRSENKTLISYLQLIRTSSGSTRVNRVNTRAIAVIILALSRAVINRIKIELNSIAQNKPKVVTMIACVFMQLAPTLQQ